MRVSLSLIELLPIKCSGTLLFQKLTSKVTKFNPLKILTKILELIAFAIISEGEKS